MKLTIHAALWLGVCSIACTLTSARMGAQTFTTTTVQGTVYLANGRAGSGTLQLSWPAFTTAGNQAVTAGRTTVTIGADGYVSVNLAPNLGSTPAGLYYTAVYHLSDGTTSTEYWVVPAAAQANLSQVRAQVMPAAQAVQAVSKGYVDQSIAELTQSLLTASGGSLSGPLFLNGDPSQPTQAATKRYVDSAFSQAVPLSGGVMSGPLTSVQLGAAYQADQFPGADFGAKLQACLNALNGTYGGTCDARNFTGTLAMGTTVAVTTANATVQLPCATIATANQIKISAGTRNVTLHGCALRGASDASGSQGGTVFLYSGAGSMIQVGDPTYSTNTVGFHLDNVVINTTASTNATTVAFTAFRSQELNLESLYLLGNSNQAGMILDGTGNYTGGTFQDIEFGGFGTALSGIGHQVSNSATTDWVNASAFLRLHINCPTSGGSPTPGTYGINLVQGDGNTFTGGDVEGCDTALHLGQNAQNNTIVGLRNENSINQVVADAGSSYNNWMTGGTMFTGQLTDNGTRNSFLDTFHRSFNGLNGDWYGSQKDATVTNHYRLGTGTGNERGLLNRYQTDWGYRWTTGLSDASAGAQFYQVLDELNNVYRLSVGQHNPGQSSTNDQTVVNAAGTGAVVLNGSTNAGTGGVIFGAGGSSGAAVATINNAGNAQFNGSLQVGGPSTFTNSTTVKNQSDAEIDSVLWAGSTANQKESVIYKDYTGASQWYMVKDATNNWALNSALGGLDSFKAYQSNNSGDTYVNASNPAGHIRLNYETGSGAETDIYSGTSSSLVAAFLGTSAIKFPGLASSSGRNCVQIDNSGYISNTGTACGTGTGGTVNAGNAGQVAYYANDGTVIAGTNSVGITSGGTGATNAQQALQNLGAQAALPGVSSDGLSGVSVSGNVKAGAAIAQSIGGLRYSSQFQTGGGNNGIANAAAANQTVVADPGYAATEQYSPTSTISNWPSAFTLQDLRGGHNLYLTHNPPPAYSPYGDPTNTDTLFYTQHDGAPAWPGDLFQIGYRFSLNSTSPGGNFDYPNVGAGAASGWEEPQALSVAENSLGSSIAIALPVGNNKTGTGDQVAGYFYNFSYNGGATGLSDEGKKAIGATNQQVAAEYSGTCSSGCTTGSIQVHTTCRTSTNGCANGLGTGSPIATGTGEYAIDSTQTPITNTITNLVNSPLSTTTISALTMGSTVPVSNGWGTQQANISTPNRMYCYLSSSSLTSVANAGGGSTVYTGTITNGANNALANCAVNIAGFGNSANNGSFTVVSSTSTTITLSNASGVAQSGSATETVYPFAAMMTFPITLVGGTGFDATHSLCFATTYHECVVPTAAVNAGGGTWNITAPLRHAHASGGYVFQGGMAGYGMEITAYTPTSGSLTFRYLFDILGSTDANTLQATWWFQGRPSVLTRLSNLNINNSLYGCANATNVSNTGTAVTATFSSFCATNFGSLPDYTGATFYFTNGSNATINGNCTGVTWTGANNTFTCTNATAAGSNSGMTATFQLSAAGQNGLNVIKLWPMAEVIDVQDYSTVPPSTNGTLTLEPNPNLVMASNDVIEEQRVAADITNGAVVSNIPINPYMFEHGLSVGTSSQLSTTGPQGGGLSVSNSNSVLGLGSSNTNSLYKGQGGYFIPPNMINFTGPYFIGLDFSQGPAQNTGLISLLHTATQVADPTYCYRIWDIFELGNAPFYLQNCPNSKAVNLVTSGLYTEQPSSYFLNTAGTATYTASSHTFNGNVTLNGSSNTLANANLTTIGGMLSGQGMNYAPFSNTLTASTWAALGGSGTVTCNITDDLGNPACTLTATNTTYAWEDSNIGVLTPLTLNASYVTQIRARGHAGGELVTIGADQIGSNKTMTTSWANYCAVVTATNSGSFLNRIANVTLNANGAAIDVSNVITVPGTSCSPAPLPITTLNNQYTAQTNVNHAGSFDANAYTLSGAATNTAGGLAALNGSAVLPTAQEGTGTPASGKYVDGAAGAWTALPLQTVNTCGTTTTCSNTAQTSARMVHGNVALTAGSAVVGSMTAWTATTSFDCTGTDKTSVAPVQIVNTSTTSITITGTGTDVIAYTCVGN